jgi:hypothetical protein
MYSWLSLSRTRLTRISGWVEFLSKSRTSLCINIYNLANIFEWCVYFFNGSRKRRSYCKYRNKFSKLRIRNHIEYVIFYLFLVNIINILKVIRLSQSPVCQAELRRNASGTTTFLWSTHCHVAGTVNKFLNRNRFGEGSDIYKSGTSQFYIKNVGPVKIQRVQQKIPGCWTYVQQNESKFQKVLPFLSWKGPKKGKVLNWSIFVFRPIKNKHLHIYMSWLLHVQWFEWEVTLQIFAGPTFFM